MWDSQMLFLAQHGFRVVAHDRRGHGRSSQAWSGNDMDGYADDLAAVIGALDVTDITMVGHSTGGGEVARYIGRYGTKRVAKAVLIAAVPPLMLKTAAIRKGCPSQIAGPTFDQLHLLFDKHHTEQNELVDEIAERIQVLGGVSAAMPSDVAEMTLICACRDRHGMTAPRVPDDCYKRARRSHEQRAETGSVSDIFSGGWRSTSSEL
jgi:pimeloyl-ACP methyl ester carboxylesterase